MSSKRFRIALSFAGEKRGFVSKVAAILAQRLGGEKVILYDKYHAAEFSRSDLAFYLPHLYRQEADLVVAVLCPDYDKREWCGLEWNAIFGLLKQRKTEEVMLTRFAHAQGEGLQGLAGYIDLDDLTPEQAATAILERLRLNERSTENTQARGGRPWSAHLNPSEGTEEPLHTLFAALASESGIHTLPKAADAESETDKFADSIRKHTEALHRSVDQLTQQQYRVIQQLRGQRRVRISGCAGSGKTLVAAEKAIRLSQAGLSTLFLCHNPLLAAQIVNMTQGSGVRVKAFGNWIAALAGAGVPVSSNLWTNYEEPSPEELERAFDNLAERGDRFEAIVVDEGQDFRQEWWTLVEQALDNPANGILYIFHDDHQALLPYRASYPIASPVLDLSRNCRNAGRVYDLMRCLHPEAPLPEHDLRGLGKVAVVIYSRGSETKAVRQAVRTLVSTAGGQPFIVLLGGTLSFDKSPFVSGVDISEGEQWQIEVRRKFHRAITFYNRTGLICPEHGWSGVESRLKSLSGEPIPSPRDIALVHKIARSFRVDTDVRRRLTTDPRFRNPMRWSQREGALKLSRPTRGGPLLAAEIALHFERDDWHEGIPQPKKVTFREHNQSYPQEAVPVYYVGAFKGLEADAVLMFVQGAAPLSSQEIYVGVSRARLLLVLLLDSDTAASLPPAMLSLNNSLDFKRAV